MSFLALSRAASTIILYSCLVGVYRYCSRYWSSSQRPRRALVLIGLLTTLLDISLFLDTSSSNQYSAAKVSHSGLSLSLRMPLLNRSRALFRFYESYNSILGHQVESRIDSPCLSCNPPHEQRHHVHCTHVSWWRERARCSSCLSKHVRS